MFAFNELVNATELPSMHEALLYIVQDPENANVVRLPRTTLKNIYHAKGGFPADGFILPSANVINTEKGPFEMQKTTYWKLTRMSPYLYPVFPESEDIIVTPIVLTGKYRMMLDSIYRPIHLHLK